MNIIRGVTRHRDPARLRGMLELAVTAHSRDQRPSIIPEKLEHITDLHGRMISDSNQKQSHITVRFSCGARLAFKLKGTNLLQEHAIAPSTASASLDADRRDIHHAFKCSPRDAAHLVQFPLLTFDERSIPIGRFLRVDLI